MKKERKHSGLKHLTIPALAKRVDFKVVKVSCASNITKARVVFISLERVQCFLIKCRVSGLANSSVLLRTSPPLQLMFQQHLMFLICKAAVKINEKQ